jgi:hypothetical protein
MIVKGSIVDIIDVSDKVTQIVIKYKKADSYIHLCFTAYQDVLVLIKFGLRAVVKVARPPICCPVKLIALLVISPVS